MDFAGPIRCPHCNAPMAQWANPELACWSGEFQYVCFNDACPYFIRGWAWMEERFNVHSSYRHRLDPTTGETGPLPVWSREALKDQIVVQSEEIRHA
ncbi:MAG: ogr/Delta-like zinc finger family protein [Acidobacteriaceae bacterium]